MTSMMPRRPQSPLVRQTAVMPMLRTTEIGLSAMLRSPMAAEGLRGHLAPGLRSLNPGMHTAPRAVPGPYKGQTGDDRVRARTCGGDEGSGKRCWEEALSTPVPPGLLFSQPSRKHTNVDCVTIVISSNELMLYTGDVNSEGALRCFRNG